MRLRRSFGLSLGLLWMGGAAQAGGQQHAPAGWAMFGAPQYHGTGPQARHYDFRYQDNWNTRPAPKQETFRRATNQGPVALVFGHAPNAIWVKARPGYRKLMGIGTTSLTSLGLSGEDKAIVKLFHGIFSATAHELDLRAARDAHLNEVAKMKGNVDHAMADFSTPVNLAYYNAVKQRESLENHLVPGSSGRGVHGHRLYEVALKTYFGPLHELERNDY